MNQRIFRVLEFDKIIERLVAHAETFIGKERAGKLQPFSKLEEVNHLQAETDEATQLLRLNRTIPFGGIRDIRSSVQRASIGGSLTALETLDIANTIYGGRQVKNFINNFEDDEITITLLKELVIVITPLMELEREIKRKIDENGEVLDSASPTLKSLRSSIHTFESSVRTKLESYTRSNSSMLSDSIVTIRNDRYVLPVKQAYRTQIGGIVHDQSSSGQTLFMEPRAVVDLNNKLQEARVKEKQEIEKILAELSALIADNSVSLFSNMDTLAHLDFIHARAKLSREMKAVKPIMNDKGIIKMKAARHPLIPEDEVVPNDVEIGEDYTSIVITGPNTGGKTVTLKMVGLCTLMAQSGLQIPAMDDCRLAVFDEVYADIGDEQSIEQNLSTFSSHMKNIVSILQHVDRKSLVLFDELGSGTDPSEGAALAMAILDEVVSRDARVIATTHYPELKAYGYNRENVINASVEFDVETLQPTYRLLLGVPGRSNAFDISQRIGLDESIINRAKTLVGVDSKNVENMITSLEESQRSAEKDYEKAHEVLLESEQLKQEIEHQWNMLEKQKENVYKKAEEKAEKALKKAKEEAEFIVETLRDMKKGASLKEHEWIEAKKILEDAQPELTKKESSKKSENQSVKKQTLIPGDEIKLLTINQQGTVLEKISDSEYMIQIGIMKVNAKREDLQLMKQKKKKAEKMVTTIKGSAAHVRPELDLRGERFEDALHRLEKYIDDALLANYSKVSIIHGKGTGALRKGVADFAKNHASISSSRIGSSSEGGSGVTILELN